jgi:hypothetical protein
MQDALPAHLAVEHRPFGEAFTEHEDSLDAPARFEPASERGQCPAGGGVGELEEVRPILEE